MPKKPFTQIPFHKLHGLGNDFVLIDEREQTYDLDKRTVRAIACRKRGVGFDQLLVLRSSPRVHALLDIYNADGSNAEMCGNGLRAAALYLWRSAAADTAVKMSGTARAKWMGAAAGSEGNIESLLDHSLVHELVIETAAGDRRARALGPIESEDCVIECEMGVPKTPASPLALKRGVRFRKSVQHPVIVNVGNPHAVVFLYPKSDKDLADWGALLENHKAFPKRTNAEFVQVRDQHIIEVRVWERGVGITEACGTGAVAAAVAAIKKGLAESPVEVRFPGGAAEVRWDGPRQSAFLRGRAHYVFSGNWIRDEQV